MRWEYLLQHLDLTSMDGLSGQLKEFGKKGWELIQIISPETTVSMVIFKRALDGPEPDQEPNPEPRVMAVWGHFNIWFKSLSPLIQKEVKAALDKIF